MRLWDFSRKCLCDMGGAVQAAMTNYDHYVSLSQLCSCWRFSWWGQHFISRKADLVSTHFWNSSLNLLHLTFPLALRLCTSTCQFWKWIIADGCILPPLSDLHFLTIILHLNQLLAPSLDFIWDSISGDGMVRPSNQACGFIRGACIQCNQSICRLGAYDRPRRCDENEV